MDEYDGVLDRLAKKGPEFGPGLSNHGPMAADALVAMGRGEDVERWAEWYAPRLVERPESRLPIDTHEWRGALGDISRAGDWSLFFQRETEQRPWRETLERWTPRLAPGIMAGATHGVLRTAHAVRALTRGETPQRIAELGEGLAYWAARYQELPTARGADRIGSASGALARVPVIEDANRGRFLIFDAVRAVPVAEFAPVIGYVDASATVEAFVGDVTRTFARVYLANAQHASIAFVHTVTAPSALRILAPHLSAATVTDVMRYAWQACAAVYSAYARPQATPPEPEDAQPDEVDLIDRAVTARDEHAIKFTEACLREYEISADAIFLQAAADVVTRLRAS